MAGNVKLRQIIAKIDFLRIFQVNFVENLTSVCHGNTFVRVMPKSTNLAKIMRLVSMETWLAYMTIPIKFNKLKRGSSYILQKTALKYLNSNQNDSSRSHNYSAFFYVFMLSDPVYLSTYLGFLQNSFTI